MLNNLKKSFTLLEILIVMSIIAIIIAVAFVSYTTLIKQSRDAKRKADLENIRAAIEMYRSNVGTYPGNVSCGGQIKDGAGNVYMPLVPCDPNTAAGYTYYYNSAAPNSDYTIAAQLEATVSSCGSPPGGNSCGTGNPCNYCEGPYGPK